jgi:hypothetical protein
MSLRSAARSLGAAFALSVASCSILGPDEDRMVLYVGAQLVPCVGVGPQTCMLTREDPDDEWGLFYSGIEGFTHESGFQYTLLVARREVEDPPADAPSLVYRLLRVLEKTAVSP